MPADTDLSPINPLPEDVAQERPRRSGASVGSLQRDEKKIFSRMAEVYAGFSEYTDAQVGRLIDYLERTEQLDNTLIFYCADNGASGEGSPNGSVNENKFFNGYPDDADREPQVLDVSEDRTPTTIIHGLGGGVHTPFKMFKRHTWEGGVADAMLV